jgi:hypothetical protein
MALVPLASNICIEMYSIRICLICVSFLFVLRSEIFRKTESSGLEFKCIFTDIEISPKYTYIIVNSVIKA